MNSIEHDNRRHSLAETAPSKSTCSLVQSRVQRRVHSRLQVVSRAVAANGHVLMLDVPPHRLDQVQLRAVWRQVEQLDARCLQSTRVLLYLLAMMRGVVVQYHHAPLLSLKALRHLSHRSAHVANLFPDELKYVPSLERGAACGISQPRIVT